MKPMRAPTCLDEPIVGADGRQGGKMRHLQSGIDALSDPAFAALPAVSPPPRTSIVTGSSLGKAGDALLEQADAICARNGLGTSRTAGHPSAGRHAAAIHVSERSEPDAPEGSPIRRSCPRCGNAMNPAATLCGYCWLRVARMGPDGIEPPPLAVRRPWWRF